MAPSALDTSAAHPLYLYVVFVVCVLAAVALLVGASLSRRSSSWRRQLRAQPSAVSRPEPAYPVEPAAAPVSTPTSDPVVAVAAAPAKKAAPRKAATTAAKKAPAKKTAAKKTPTAKKATARPQQ